MVTLSCISIKVEEYKNKCYSGNIWLVAERETEDKYLLIRIYAGIH